MALPFSDCGSDHRTCRRSDLEPDDDDGFLEIEERPTLFGKAQHRPQLTSLSILNSFQALATTVGGCFR